MKRIVLILNIAIFLISCIKEEHTNGLVYEVTKTGSQTTSYLIGSIHFIPERIFNKDDSRFFFKYIDKCEYLILEANWDSAYTIHERFKKEFAIKSNKEILKENELLFLTQFVKDTLKQDDSTFFEILDLDPLTTCSKLERLYKNEKYFYMDKYLRSYGKQSGKKIKYLDSPDRFYFYYCQYYLQTYNDPWYKSDSAKNQYFYELSEVFNEYGKHSFNTDSLRSISNEKLLRQRNLEWLPEIQQMIENGNCAIVIGRSHLEGLIELLTNNGYKIEPK